MRKRVLKRMIADLPRSTQLRRKVPDVSNVELWDCETPIGNLDPLVRGHRTDISLKRKVELLELWAKEGWPEDVDPMSLAKNETRLRKWSDPTRKLWSWSDDKPEKRERNKALMLRWSEAISSIRREDWKSVRPVETLESLHLIIERLEVQVADLIAQNSWLEKRLLDALAGMPDG